jgi:hypothetical protein
MDNTGPVELQTIRAGLRAAFSAKDSATHLLFNGSVIGQMVTRPEPGSRRVVYVGRLLWQDRAIEVEAASSSRLLNKIASVIVDCLTGTAHPVKELEPE